MPIDASIPLGVRQFEAPDQLNQLAKIMHIQGLQDQQSLSAYTLKKAQRDDEDANALADVYRSALSPDGTLNRNALYSGAAQRGLGARIPDIQKKFADTDKVSNESEKLKSEVIDARLKQSRDMLAGVQTPEQYVQWHLANHADPVLGPVLAARGITPEQSMARIQQALQTPGGFEQLLQQSALGMQKFMELNKPTVHMQDTGGASNVVSVPGMGGAPTVLSSTPKTPTPADQQRAVNEPFTVGTDGNPVPNVPAQQFQLNKAKAGATNVSVSTEKGYAGHMAEGLAKQDLAALDAARGAQERIANAQRVKQILDTQPTITGSGAEGRLAFSKALSTAGLIDGQAVKSTEDLASLLASSTLDAIRTSGLGSGQGFTDKDRQFLERAKSGNIEINSGTLRTLADLNEKAARASIDAGAKVSKRLKGNPNFGTVGQDIDFTQPPEYKGPPVVKKPPAAAASGGVRFLGFE